MLSPGHPVGPRLVLSVVRGFDPQRCIKGAHAEGLVLADNFQRN